jgi:hypothetical protein
VQQQDAGVVLWRRKTNGAPYPTIDVAPLCWRTSHEAGLAIGGSGVGRLAPRGARPARQDITTCDAWMPEIGLRDSPTLQFRC